MKSFRSLSIISVVFSILGVENGYIKTYLQIVLWSFAIFLMIKEISVVLETKSDISKGFSTDDLLDAGLTITTIGLLTFFDGNLSLLWIFINSDFYPDHFIICPFLVTVSFFLVASLLDLFIYFKFNEKIFEEYRNANRILIAFVLVCHSILYYLMLSKYSIGGSGPLISFLVLLCCLAIWIALRNK